MTTPKQPASLPEDEEMDPVGEPYPNQEPLGPGDGDGSTTPALLSGYRA